MIDAYRASPLLRPLPCAATPRLFFRFDAVMRIARIVTAAFLVSGSLVHYAHAQDAFEELQGQVEEQLREQGQDPSKALTSPDDTAPGTAAPDDQAAPDASGAGGQDDGTTGSLGTLDQGEAVPSRPVLGERVKNPVAVFSGLDKITGKITSFDVYINETVQFGALQVTPKVCYTSAKGEAARTDAFVQVDEITLKRKIRQIFSGWMFADSPGLNAVEHPVYDVWLKSCKTESDVPPPEG